MKRAAIVLLVFVPETKIRAVGVGGWCRQADKGSSTQRSTVAQALSQMNGKLRKILYVIMDSVPPPLTYFT